MTAEISEILLLLEIENEVMNFVLQVPIVLGFRPLVKIIFVRY